MESRPDDGAMIKWKRGNHLAANKGPRRDSERKVESIQLWTFGPKTSY